MRREASTTARLPFQSSAAYSAGLEAHLSQSKRFRFYRTFTLKKTPDGLQADCEASQDSDGDDCQWQLAQGSDLLWERIFVGLQQHPVPLALLVRVPIDAGVKGQASKDYPESLHAKAKDALVSVSVRETVPPARALRARAPARGRPRKAGPHQRSRHPGTGVYRPHESQDLRLVLPSRSERYYLGKIFFF